MHYPVVNKQPTKYSGNVSSNFVCDPKKYLVDYCCPGAIQVRFKLLCKSHELWRVIPHLLRLRDKEADLWFEEDGPSSRFIVMRVRFLKRAVELEKFSGYLSSTNYKRLFSGNPEFYVSFSFKVFIAAVPSRDKTLFAWDAIFLKYITQPFFEV